MARTRNDENVSSSSSSSSSDSEEFVDDQNDGDYEPALLDSESESISDEEVIEAEEIVVGTVRRSSLRDYLMIACVFSLAVFGTVQNWDEVRPMLLEYASIARHLVF